jgi:phage-related protein
VPGRRVVWVGDSKKNLMGFPKDVKVSIGYALSEAQKGRKAGFAKPRKPKLIW